MKGEQDDPSIAGAAEQLSAEPERVFLPAEGMGLTRQAFQVTQQILLLAIKSPSDSNAPQDEARFGKQLDRELARQGLVNLKRLEFLGDKKDFAKKARSKESHFRFPQHLELIDTDQELAGFLFRVGIDGELLWRASCDFSIINSSVLGELFGGAPADLMESHLRKLFSQKRFGDREDIQLERVGILPVPEHFWNQFPCGHVDRKIAYDRKLELSAYLVGRNLNRPDLVEMYAPALRYEDFHRLQAKVQSAVRRSIPELHKKFGEAWKTLTDAQKEAINLVYLQREVDESQREIAAGMEIELSSLRSRVQGAIEKLSKEMDLKAIPQKRSTATVPHKRDLLYNGLYSRSGASQVHALFRLTPYAESCQEIPPSSARPLPAEKLEKIREKMRQADGFIELTSSDTDCGGGFGLAIHQWAGHSCKRLLQEDMKRPYEIWRRTYKEQLELHQGLLDERKPPTPLSDMEAEPIPSAWISSRRLREPKCLQLPPHEDSCGRFEAFLKSRPPQEKKIQEPLTQSDKRLLALETRRYVIVQI